MPERRGGWVLDVSESSRGSVWKWRINTTQGNLQIHPSCKKIYSVLNPSASTSKIHGRLSSPHITARVQTKKSFLPFLPFPSMASSVLELCERAWQVSDISIPALSTERYHTSGVTRWLGCSRVNPGDGARRGHDDSSRRDVNRGGEVAWRNCNQPASVD